MQNSKIEWTDHTFNPWIGCTKISTGCTNCYAEALMDKRFNRAEWGPQGKRIRTSDANWKKPLSWNRQAAKLNTRQRVFCASLADVFEDKPDQLEMNQWRHDLFSLIAQTPNLDWLLLTKRPENISRLIETITGFDEKEWCSNNSHVWFGISAEDQDQLHQRIAPLMYLQTPNRFLSLEPLLGPIELSGYLSVKNSYAIFSGIEWVIVGGESGPNARPAHPDSVRSLRDQCHEQQTPFFFKQWGEYAPDCLCDSERLCTTVSRQFGKPGVMFKCGKRQAGNTLDGQQWQQFPAEIR